MPEDLTRTKAAIEQEASPLRHIGEVVEVNIGPSHPATHGTLRIKLWLDGETIVKARTEIGYLHRCFEKMAETHPYNQVFPYCDRLNYCSPFINTLGYAIAVEKMIGIDKEIPERVNRARVILSEFNRVMDHAVCIAANLVDVGALTNFWYFYKPREDIYGLMEACCGARLTYSYCRVGGLMMDLPEDFVRRCRALLDDIPRYMGYVDGLITKNRIFIDRARGISPVTREQAIDWGWTGPCLRASGEPYDVRKAFPYSGYEDYEFDVPVGERGDVYDRYLVRMEETRQSLRIIDQALKDFPEKGPFRIEDKRISLPSKEDVYTAIEPLMNQFKLIMHGIQPPKGELYSCVEGANGELGYYLISDGGSKPYRLHCRGPCFALYQPFEKLLVGHKMADVVAILGSFNIIAGELDR